MSKTTNEFSAEVRDRAVRPVLDNEGQHRSRWQSVISFDLGGAESFGVVHDSAARAMRSSTPAKEADLDFGCLAFGSRQARRAPKALRSSR